jgi:metallo-beta-lactamase family protein
MEVEFMIRGCRGTFSVVLILILFLSNVIGCAGNDQKLAKETSGLASNITYTGYGANGIVSGSLHILEMDGDKIILDAGLFYGNDGANIPLLTKSHVENVSAVIVSHAHLDHIGRLSQLLRLGYSGPIYCTEPTKDILPIMLRMEAKYGDFGSEQFYYSALSKAKNDKTGKMTAIHLYNCEYGSKIYPKNKKTIFSTRKALEKQSFYLCNSCADIDVGQIMDQVKVLPIATRCEITENLNIEFLNTPHIPGSVMVLVNSNNSNQTVLYTGDFGSGNSRFLPRQAQVETADYAIIEGTYGIPDGNLSLSNEEERLMFQKYIGECVSNNKRVIIPAFVLDRSQQVLGEISRGMESGYIPRTSVKIFSPSTSEINKLYANTFTQPEYQPYFSTEYFLKGPFNPIFFMEKNEVEQIEYGEIALASSGMADTVYSKDFIKQWISDPQTVFIFVGYQDPETIGGIITKSGVSGIIIDENQYVVAAEIKKFNCFSGHGSYIQISQFLSNIEGLKKVVLVHSDKPVAEKLIQSYQQDLPEIKFVLPASGELIVFN